MSESLVDDYGNKFWLSPEGEHHREDGPAIIYKNGTREWWQNGGRHREDGPAIVPMIPDGTEEWWLFGLRHRKDGPAKIYYGRSEWWQSGNLHRDDGPAVETHDGRLKEWWQNGQRFRDDGPSIIQLSKDGTTESHIWWMNGRHLSGQIEEWMQENNITWPFNEDALISFRLCWC